MKVGVTGATGFIGKLLCEALVLRGDDVVILTRRSDLHVPGCRSVLGDLTLDSTNLDAFVEGLEVIYHCAGELLDSQRMHALHVDGTRNLLQAARRQVESSGRSLRWVQLSSVGAYGPGEGPADLYRLVDESAVPAPVGEYEVTKTLSDDLVMAMAAEESRLVITILRPSNVVGASMTNRSFFQLATMVKKRLFFFLGKGDALATYVHVDDVVRALVACGTQEAAKGQLYVLSNDCEQRELINAIADFHGVSRPRLRLPAAPMYWLVAMLPKGRTPLSAARLDALLKRTTYSTRKIQRDLDFHFDRSIPESIPELLGNPVRKGGK
ncbi:NAD-dependent epimerase/dehydratase family protein [Pseudomonas wadenswilerensis]